MSVLLFFLTQVYCDLPHPYKGRARVDSERWPGPAVILAADGPSRYFIGHRNTTLLVAAEILRHASAKEAMAAEAVAKTPGE